MKTRTKIIITAFFATALYPLLSSGNAFAIDKRTAQLDLSTSTESVDNPSEGWSWDNSKKILALNGINFDITKDASDESTLSGAIHLPADSTIIVSGENTIKNHGHTVAILALQSLTVEKKSASENAIMNFHGDGNGIRDYGYLQVKDITVHSYIQSALFYSYPYQSSTPRPITLDNVNVTVHRPLDKLDDEEKPMSTILYSAGANTTADIVTNITNSTFQDDGDVIPTMHFRGVKETINITSSTFHLSDGRLTQSNGNRVTVDDPYATMNIIDSDIDLSGDDARYGGILELNRSPGGPNALNVVRSTLKINRPSNVNSTYGITMGSAEKNTVTFENSSYIANNVVPLTITSNVGSQLSINNSNILMTDSYDFRMGNYYQNTNPTNVDISINNSTFDIKTKQEGKANAFSITSNNSTVNISAKNSKVSLRNSKDEMAYISMSHNENTQLSFVNTTLNTTQPITNFVKQSSREDTYPTYVEYDSLAANVETVNQYNKSHGLADTDTIYYRTVDKIVGNSTIDHTNKSAYTLKYPTGVTTESAANYKIIHYATDEEGAIVSHEVIPFETTEEGFAIESTYSDFIIYKVSSDESSSEITPEKLPDNPKTADYLPIFVASAIVISAGICLSAKKLHSRR